MKVFSLFLADRFSCLLRSAEHNWFLGCSWTSRNWSRVRVFRFLFLTSFVVAEKIHNPEPLLEAKAWVSFPVAKKFLLFCHVHCIQLQPLHIWNNRQHKHTATHICLVANHFPWNYFTRCIWIEQIGFLTKVVLDDRFDIYQPIEIEYSPLAN